MSAHMLTQIILTPIYLNTLNDEKFGILMIFLNIITFAVLISWFSGGLVRLLGEYWSNKKITKFNETLILGKYVFTSYALLTALLSLILYYFLKQFGYLNSIEFFTVILILIYFILKTIHTQTERQAFVATNWQALGNNIEITKIIVFFFLVIFLLPKYKSLNVVFAALIAGVITQRVVTGIYLRFKIDFLVRANSLIQ